MPDPLTQIAQHINRAKGVFVPKFMQGLVDDNSLDANGTISIQLPGLDASGSPTSSFVRAQVVGGLPENGHYVWIFYNGGSWVCLGQINFGTWAPPGQGELWSAQLTTGNVTSTANTEASIVTLGPRTYRGGRKYEIRATVSLQNSGLTRMLCRLRNVTDTLRSNLIDGPPPQINLYSTYSAVMRFSPGGDVTKEFDITFQNAVATNTVTCYGSALSASGGVPALISAWDVGPQ